MNKNEKSHKTQVTQPCKKLLFTQFDYVWHRFLRI